MEQHRLAKIKALKGYFAIFYICALCFLCFCMFPFFMMKGFVKWENLDFNTNITDKCIIGMVLELEGPYHTIHPDDNQASAYYYVYIDDTHIIPVEIHQDDQLVEKAKEYMKMKSQFQEGKILDDEYSSNFFKSMAIIRETTNDGYVFMDDLHNYLNSNSNMKNIEILPYYIEVVSLPFIIICEMLFGGFALSCILLVAFCKLRIKTPLGEKMITKYRKEHGDTLELQNKIVTFFRTKQVLPRLWMDNEYIAGIYNTKTIFGNVKDIVWVYRKDIHKSTGNGIADAAIVVANADPPASVKIYFKNRKSYYLQMDSGENADKTVELFRRNCPWVVTEETQEMRKKHRKKEYPFFD